MVEADAPWRAARGGRRAPAPAAAAGAPGGAGRAPVIRGDVPGSFARGVLTERHPALRAARAAFPYDRDRHRALDALRDELSRDVIEPLPSGAHDGARWAAWGREHFGRSWLGAPFLWAESYFYRRLLGAVGYFGPGPWRGIDPFRPFKVAELDTEEAGVELAVLDELASRPAAEQAVALLHGSLWGNRADLGFRVGRGDAEQGGTGAPLVVDDTAELWTLLPAGPPDATGTAPGAPTGPGTGTDLARAPDSARAPDPARPPGPARAPDLPSAAPAGRTVCLVADNSGRELVPDLLLVDHLLRHGRAARVLLHLKPYPYYVSDATTADVLDCLRHLRAGGTAAAAAGERLWAAAGDGRLVLRAHPFFCAPLPFSELPGELREEFAGAAVTILKGDLNYRRLVGDRDWPATTPFADVTGYFPSPVAALRTLKSDVVTGLEAATEASLAAAHGRRWRTAGSRALVQVRR